MSDTRDDLARALRTLRRESGLTAATVARRAVMSPPKLSKIENGHAVPSLADVERILTALGVSPDARERFAELASAARTEQRAWRTLLRSGWHKLQADIAAIEAQTQTQRLFQPALIPGLLQTPEYGRAILELPHTANLSTEMKNRTLAARLERQAVLYEPTKRFEFLITESALRWRIGGVDVAAAQVERVASLSHLPNVSVGILPADAIMPDFAMHVFAIFDDRLVAVETFHADVSTRDPQDIEMYRDLFTRFGKTAVYGDAMRAELNTLAARFRNG